jgi:PAS domain S-box-containing protein
LEVERKREGMSYSFKLNTTTLILCHHRDSLLVPSALKSEDSIMSTESSAEHKKAEEALSEERFSKAFRNNPAAMAISCADGKIVDVNESFERLMGYARDQVIGKIGCDIGLYSPSEAEELFRQLKEKGRVSNFEMNLRQKTGNQVNVLFSLEQITLNKEPYSLGIAIDNTERKKAEKALKESEERFRALVESTSDMIWQVDEKAVYTYISPKVKDILGYEPQEIVGKTPFDLIDDKDEEKILKSFLEIANKKEPFYGLENWNVHKNGSRVLLETSGVPILDEKGQLMGYRGIDRDITERKKTEEALANAQVTLKRQLDEIRFYYDVAPVGLAVFDTNLRYVKVNKRLAEINGVPPEDHVGKSISEVVPSVAEQIEKLLKQTISTGNPIQNLEITGEAIDMPGVKRTLFESFQPMKDSEGFVIGVNVVAQEITEQKQMQAKLQEYSKNLEQLVEERTKQLQDKERLAAIGATAGMVGHDIRNPLQAIAGDLYLMDNDVASLNEGKTKESLQESVKSIQGNLFYIAKIVEDLQDYAKPLRPQFERVRIEKVLEEVMLLTAVSSVYQVIIDIENGFPEFTADYSMLKRSLSNLVQNAIQAMPNGGRLEIAVHKKDNNVIITVSDTGEGIPDGVKADLFKPLVTTKSKGQGLGLAVVKRLVEALNGQVSFESEEGKGTKFTIELPA